MFAKNTWCYWYDCLINYILETRNPKSVGSVKNKTRPFLKQTQQRVIKTKTCQKNAWYWRESRETKNTKNSEEIIKVIRNFKLNKENEAITPIIIRNIKTLFEQEKYYYQPVREGNV